MNIALLPGAILFQPYGSEWLITNYLASIVHLVFFSHQHSRTIFNTEQLLLQKISALTMISDNIAVKRSYL